MTDVIIEEGFKICKGGKKAPGCGKILLLKYFKTIKKTNKYKNICKSCENLYKQAWRAINEPKKVKLEARPGYKFCIGGIVNVGCKEELPLECFNIIKQSGNYKNICNDCDIKFRKVYYEINGDKINEERKIKRIKKKNKKIKKENILFNKGLKRCKASKGKIINGCNKILDLTNFDFNIKTNKYSNICKFCYKAYHEEYREKNIDIIKQKDKQRGEKNKVRKAKYNKKWRANNPDKVKVAADRKAKKQKNDYNYNYNYKLRKSISGSVAKTLKQNGSSKRGKSFIKYVNWTEEELLEHIKSLFSHPDNLTSDGKVWMTMENHGVIYINKWNDNDSSTWVWHLDHIIPHSKFKYTSMDCQEFRDCWDLSNLRPLRADLNIEKSNK